MFCYVVLKFTVLLRIYMGQGRADDGNCTASFFDGSFVRDPIYPGRKSRHDSKIWTQFPYEATSSSYPITGWVAGADDSYRPRFGQVPPTLVVQECYRIPRISEFLRVLSGTMDADTKMANISFFEALLHEFSTALRLRRRHEV